LAGLRITNARPARLRPGLLSSLPWRGSAGRAGNARRKASPPRPTMIDVANEARVSQTTVSLVLNHADGARLSAETRERMMKAAASLGYQPVRRGGAPGSAAASIGFICDEISTDPWTAIAPCLASTSASKGDCSRR
jgi:Bacterial regulatory proteins, lacI family